MSEVLVSLRNATKVFGGTIAIKDVSFNVRAGEVLALLGENGAGKSTCVKLLAGVYKADSGDIFLGNDSVDWASPTDAQRSGISVMHQHPGLFPDLTVVENIFFGHFIKNPQGFLDWHAMAEKAIELLDTVGLDVAPNQVLKNLRVSEQQLIEVARALSTNADVLIMDEPTAALSQREVEKLFSVVERLKARGVGLVFVSHRMDEIFRLSDRIAILRDGELIAVESVTQLTRDAAINMMVGRDLSTMYPEGHHEPGELVLEVDALCVDGQFEDVGFTVRAGEIVGIGGLVGSGRTEVAGCLFGITRPSRGTIKIDGEPVEIKSPRSAMKKGIAYVSEDRLAQSLIMDFSIRVNGSLTVLDQCTHWGQLNQQEEIGVVEEHLKKLKLRFAHYDQEIRDLSGGNQQKVVLAKWLATKPNILILDEPTQGIDVQSKAKVHEMMVELAASGMAIVLISSEMPELLGMCDRIVVLREGRQAADFERGSVSQEDILKAATGSNDGESLTDGDDQAIAVTSGQTVTRTSPSLFERLFATREIGLLAAIAAIVIPITIMNPRMLSATNLTSLTMDVALLGLVALGQMLVILTRNIDLSVASVIGLSAYSAALVMSANPEFPVVVAILSACLIGLLAGAINGVVIAFGGVPSIVATLGTMSVFRGAHSLWADGDQISADEVPVHWLDIASIEFLGLPFMVVLSLLVLAAGSWLLSRTTYGREVYAVGSNPEGADLIGISARKRVFSVFLIAGLLAGLMGALWASRYATVDARVAFGYELTVIAAVVVGGVAIRGGSGTVLGILLGALVLLVIRNGLTLVRVDPLWLQGIYGLVILVAIGIDARISARRERLVAQRVTL